ncbi:MAG: hypothetical protein IRY97_01380 [Thermomicrobiaceae bacterium]|nr:hypothetical protein [Thermomicrobiaceae bacterium]
MRWWRAARALASAAILLALTVARGEASPAQPTYPGLEWEAISPEQAGMDAAALQAFVRYVGGRGVVVRGGYLVRTWGDPARPDDIFSAHKVFNSFFLMKAVQVGRLDSLDTKVAAYEPCLTRINAKLGYKDRDITFKQMANQLSDYGVTEAPGTAFDYNDWQTALFEDTLFLKVWGAGSWDRVDEQVFYPWLGRTLQFQDHPTMTAFSPKRRPGRVAISPRDFARFGLLFLRKGNWRGTQVLSEEYATMAVSDPVPNAIPRTQGIPAEMCPGQRSDGSKAIPDDQTGHHGSYSWHWWINGVDAAGHRLWPDAPPDAFASIGKELRPGLVVIPSLDLVASWNDATFGAAGGSLDGALARLAAAAREPFRPPARPPPPGGMPAAPIALGRPARLE